MYKKKVLAGDDSGKIAFYEKVVDINEKTISFVQKIYDKNENLIEIHEKFPFDKGYIVLIILFLISILSGSILLHSL